MRFPLLSAALVACPLGFAQVRALVTPQQRAAPHLVRAFAANAPHGYTPQTVSCPSDVPSVRSAEDLSANETAWLQLRRNAILEPLRDLLSRMNITGLDTDAYIDDNRDNASALPIIGIAASGGGYRAMLNGAGIIEAFDSRTTNSTAPGQLGGLLQSATYLAGLSGGSWLVGSIYGNNFTSIDQILATSNASDEADGVWQLGNTIFEGPDTGGIQLLDSAGYWTTMVDDVDGKKDADFNITITDYWGRALSYQLINAKDGGPAYTWSSIAQQDWFTSASVPLPLIVSDSRAPNTKIVSGNSTIFVFSPWEFGSNDPTLYAFSPMQYVGTDFLSGGPLNSEKCIVGFDNIGYVFGTSSTLFNAALTTINGTNTTGLLGEAVQKAVVAILSDIGSDNDDIAAWPNPFYGYSNDTNFSAQNKTLTLVDGGEDNQNIPLYPLIQPNRHVDVVFAIDSSADTNTTYPTDSSSANWPNGASLVATYERSLTPIGNGTVFPAVPDINTFVNLGLNNRPTFFGCDSSKLSGPSPLIVYMPNAPYVYNSNVSTYDLQYDDSQRNAIILNAYNMATQGNATLDAEWPACVGCAILSRSLERTGTTVPDICTQCFQRYCWNGTTASEQPASYVPNYKIAGAAVKTSGAFRSAISIALPLALSGLTSLILI